jgi:hypothetical protein
MYALALQHQLYSSSHIIEKKHDVTKKEWISLIFIDNKMIFTYLNTNDYFTY